MRFDRKTTVAAVSMALLTTVFGVVTLAALISDEPTESDQHATPADPTITVIRNGSMVVIHLDPETSVSGETGSADGPGDGSGIASPSRATTAPPGATTTAAGTVATTVVTPTSRPELYTVSGWPIPSNYFVPSKWWGTVIPDYPLGNWTKCALEDDGWACEVG